MLTQPLCFELSGNRSMSELKNTVYILQHCSQRYEYLRNSILLHWHFSPYGRILKIDRAD